MAAPAPPAVAVIPAGAFRMGSDSGRANERPAHEVWVDAFALAVTPKLLGNAILWAVTIGLIGGLFPAIRAARRPIAAGLREM